MGRLIGIDIEVQDDKIWCLGISDGEQRTASRDWRGMLAKLGPDDVPVFHNAKYDMEFIEREGGPKFKTYRDTIHEAHLLGHRPLALPSLSQTFLGEPLDKTFVKERKKVRFEEREDEVLAGCSKDAWASRKLTDIFGPKVAKYEGLLADEREITRIIRDMERTGLPVSQEKLKKARLTILKGMARCEAVMRAHGLEHPSHDDTIGQKFWRGKKGLKHTPTGQLSTTRRDLTDAMTEVDRPWVMALVEWRQLKKFRSTYIDHWAGQDFVHHSLNQTGTATWRFSCSNPNLQNVTKSKAVPLYHLFAAPEGYVFISADYKEVELRVLAVLSQDPEMLKAYRAGISLHQITVDRLRLLERFGGNKDEARRFAKTINFGIAYGITEWGLAPRLTLSREAADKMKLPADSPARKPVETGDAAKLIKAFYRAYQAVRPWQGQQVEFAQGTGYVETFLGRPLYVPGITAESGKLMYHARNQCMNYNVQGGATEVVKAAMRRAPKYLVNQVHDELLYLVPELEAKDYLAWLSEVLVDKSHDIPYTVDIKMGKTWGELKDLEDIWVEHDSDD